MQYSKYKLVFVVLAFVLAAGVLCVLIACGRSGVRVYIDAPTSAVPDSDFVAEVAITDVERFDAANYDVLFDSSVLEVTDVTAGLVDTDIIPVNQWGVVASGTLRVVQNVPGIPGVSGSGYLAQIRFHVISKANCSSTIDLSSGTLSDSAAQAIPASWIGDLISVHSAATTPSTNEES